MCCPKCSSIKFIKSGKIKEKQRYKCLNCKCQFTENKQPGSQLHLKMHAVNLFISGVSMNSVAKILGVSPPTVMRWVHQFSELLGKDFPKESLGTSEKSNLEMICSEFDYEAEVILTRVTGELAYITLRKRAKEH